MTKEKKECSDCIHWFENECCYQKLDIRNKKDWEYIKYIEKEFPNYNN